MRRALKLLANSLLALLALAAALVLLVLAEPGWLLNDRTLAWAVKKFGAEYRPRWTRLDLEVRSVDLTTERVVFRAADLCADAADGSLSACFPVLELDATVRLGLSPPVSVRRLDRLVVRAEDVRVDERVPAPAPKPAKKGGRSFSALRAVEGMTTGLVDVKLDRARVLTSSGATTLAATALLPGDGTSPLTARVDVSTAARGSAPARYRADLTLDTDLWRRGSVSVLDLKARVRGRGLDAAASATARPEKDGVSLRGRARARAGGRTLTARLDGRAGPAEASARAALAVEDSSGPVRRAALEDCRFRAAFTKDRAPRDADLRCGLAVEPAPFGGPAGSPPKRMTGALEARADFKHSRPLDDRFAASAKAEIRPQKSWHSFHARLDADATGRTRDLPASLAGRYRLEAGLTIERFQELVAWLRDTEMAVPAPVNAFSGPVTLEARAAGDARAAVPGADLRLTADLGSAKQSFKAEAQGRVELPPPSPPGGKIKASADVELKDVALQLPDVKLGKLPSPAVDTRIKTGDPARDAAAEARRPQARPSTGTAVDFDARVRTAAPVRLLTNLFPSPVPVTLDLRARPEGLSGTIRIEPFDAVVFRQKARVDHVTLTARPGFTDLGLDGKLVYKREGSTIDILLNGSTDKPRVTFDSDPPMTQDEIVALLLYGRPPEQLDTDQQASAGNASAAFAQGALGVGSLYLFASTPIDSVGYDPATQSYQVRFKLPGGATLAVGSNLEESRTVSVRKRVARNVAVETQLGPDQPGSRRDAVTTFLEWFRRF